MSDLCVCFVREKVNDILKYQICKTFIFLELNQYNKLIF